MTEVVWLQTVRADLLYWIDRDGCRDGGCKHYSCKECQKEFIKKIFNDRIAEVSK